MIVTNVGRDAVDAAASGAHCGCRAAFTVSDMLARMNGASPSSPTPGRLSRGGGANWRRRLRTAKPCGPGTRCWCQVGGGEVEPNRARPAIPRSTTVARRIRRRGERGISRRNHCAGQVQFVCTPEPVCSCARFCMHFAHGRPRVQRAPGLPRALFLLEDRVRLMLSVAQDDAKFRARCAATSRGHMPEWLFEIKSGKRASYCLIGTFLLMTICRRRAQRTGRNRRAQTATAPGGCTHRPRLRQENDVVAAIIAIGGAALKIRNALRKDRRVAEARRPLDPGEFVFRRFREFVGERLLRCAQHVDREMAGVLENGQAL